MRSIPTPKESELGRVLVVGGGGRLGSLLRRSLLLQGQSGFLWQSRRDGNFDVRFDPLTEPHSYNAAAKGVTAILNLAGVTSAAAGNLEDHTTLGLAALRAAATAGVPHVFLASSAAVYGRAEGRVSEDTPVAPLSDYGRAKRAMELAALEWCARSGEGAPRVTCLRIGNVAGADQLLGGPDTAALRPLDVFPGGHGPARSYIGPQALARILTGLFAASRAGRPLPTILNVALDGTVTMDALLSADGRGWQPRAAGAEVIPQVCLDVRELQDALGDRVPKAAAAEIVADLRSLAEVPA